MNRDKFVNSHLELLVQERDMKRYFQGTPEQVDILKNRLRESLEKSYDVYGREYFETRGLGSYLSTALRVGGAATDLLGTYMFWALGGAGFGAKGLGLAEKSIADLIDGAHYARTAKTGGLAEKVKDEGLSFGEGVLERVAAYTPFTFGAAELLDLSRGRSKFDRKVIFRTLYHAKKDFLDYMRKTKPLEEEIKTIGLSKFKHPDYAEYKKAA